MPGTKGSTRLSATFGLVAYVAVVAMLNPRPLRPDWVLALLALAPLVLVPVCLGVLVREGLLGESRWPRLVRAFRFVAAICFAAALLRSAGTAAILLAAPWLVASIWIALEAAIEFVRRRRSLAEFCAAAGSVYLVVGAAFGVFHCAAYRPLDFQPIIVLLTAVHFHYAGFLLPALSALLLRGAPSRLNRFGSVGVVAGMPLVATGINFTQWGFAPWMETTAACFFAVFASAIALGYVRLAFAKQHATPARVLWGLGGVSLAASMVLAALYGLRFFLPLPYVTIPWMHAVHGTINALGFAATALGGWWSNADGREA